jgi:hypothetical protein
MGSLGQRAASRIRREVGRHFPLSVALRLLDQINNRPEQVAPQSHGLIMMQYSARPAEAMRLAISSLVLIGRPAATSGRWR